MCNVTIALSSHYMQHHCVVPLASVRKRARSIQTHVIVLSIFINDRFVFLSVAAAKDAFRVCMVIKY